MRTELRLKSEFYFGVYFVSASSKFIQRVQDKSSSRRKKKSSEVNNQPDNTSDLTIE